MSSVEYQRAYYEQYLRAARGHRPMVDRRPAAERVAELARRGMSACQIAAEAGISDTTVRDLLHRPEGRMLRSTAARVLAVPVRYPVTPVGITRRVRALCALGWSVTAIAREAGLTTETVKMWRRGTVQKAHVATEPLLRAYDALSMRTPPVSTGREGGVVRRVARVAMANGWAPPLAWDDSTIDDPAATPDCGHAGGGVDPVAVERAIAGDTVELTKEERVLVVARFAALGYSDAQIAARVGVTMRTVSRDRAEHGIPSRWAA